MAAQFGVFCTLRGVFSVMCVLCAGTQHSNWTSAAGTAQSVLSLSYRLDRPGFESCQEGDKDVFWKTFRPGPTHRRLFSRVTETGAWGGPAHLHPVPNLKVGGALPTLFLRSFIACIGSDCLVTLIYTFALTVVPCTDSVLQMTLMFRRSLYIIRWHICTYFHIFLLYLLFAVR
jgi:hypothetical protein